MGMKLYSRNIFIAVFILFLLVSLYPFFLGQFKEIEEISLSDLAAKIKAGEVKEIAV